MRLVVHCKVNDFHVYIGRPSVWGNPFSHLPRTLAKYQCKSRKEAITKYEEWIRARPDLCARAKRELKGKILGCWCAPHACHGDVLVRIANEPVDQGGIYATH